MLGVIVVTPSGYLRDEYLGREGKIENMWARVPHFLALRNLHPEHTSP